MRTLVFCVVLGVGCSLLVAPSAIAQGEGALAEALYKSAIELMEQGRDAEACPKLKQSQQVDPAVGTLLYLGLCYERLGKTASAWAAYREAGEASRKANQPERREIAMERANKLEAALSTLTVLMAAEQQKPGMQITLDGAPIGAAAIGVPMPVDPGIHVVEVSAPGYRPLSQHVEVNHNRDARTLSLGALEAVSAPAPQGEAPAMPAPVSPVRSQDRGTPSLGPQRSSGLVVGGVGVVGLAAGAYFGLRMRSKEDDARANCGNYPTDCNPDGLSANDDAKSAAAYATAGLIVGGAALLGGILLYSTAPTEKSVDVSSLRVDPRVGSDGGGLSVTGLW